MAKMKILVIGASGLLAGPVIRKLDENGFDLRLFSRTVSPSMFINDHDIVRGDLFNQDDLEKAMTGCDAVHISISTSDDVKAVSTILETAKNKGIRFISLISGCTVAEENRWFKFIDDKLTIEQMIIKSGIPYYIFRPTWFFESLTMMVRDGKASLPGHLTERYHWVAADDLGRMVVNAYSAAGAENNIYYVYGPEKYTMKEMLEKYCDKLYPSVKTIRETPISLLRIIAFVTGNKKLKFAASLFSYFEKVNEPEIPDGELARLGKAEISFDRWIASQM
jgi:uncharacterized protein YbjT (DUF2867 family)